MFKKPNFHEYVMTRLISLVVGIFLLTTILFLLFIEQSEHTITYIILIAISFSLFTFAISKGAKKMQQELSTINNYLENLESLSKIDSRLNFFTSEFHEINQNLTRILLESKKREDIKQKYNAKLKLKNLQKSDMISAISHEFRNPISSIMGYAQTLEEESDLSSKMQSKFLHKIHNNGKKIDELLSRLVLWNQFENNETKLHIEKFNLNESIKLIITTLQDKYINRDIIFNEPQIIIAIADKTLMEIVIKNLIENALKYSKDEIVITLTLEELIVKDKGIGIATEDIEKVTKKFYRTNTNTWDNSMGLGLAIVKKILTMHKTTLIIVSEKDKGSSFSFKLPKL